MVLLIKLHSVVLNPISSILFDILVFFNHRQERFIRRWVEALSDPRITYEIRSIWISYWSQVSTPSYPIFIYVLGRRGFRADSAGLTELLHFSSNYVYMQKRI